jgi:hypothetical protein
MRSSHAPADAAALFDGLDGAWWIAGGWAIDLWLGRQTRPHVDLDVAILRTDQGRFWDRLVGWDLWLGPDTELRPFEGPIDVKAPDHAVWCRPDPASEWAFELLLNESAGDRWLFRRDPTVSLPIADIGGRTNEGVPFLAPEIVLLYKAKQRRPHDELDLAVTLPTLSDRQRTWLGGAIELVHPGHPWLAVFNQGTR